MNQRNKCLLLASTIVAGLFPATIAGSENPAPSQSQAVPVTAIVGTLASHVANAVWGAGKAGINATSYAWTALRTAHPRVQYATAIGTGMSMYYFYNRKMLYDLG